MEKSYFCMACGDKNYDKSTHEESPRHQRALANMALEIIYRFRNCPWCEPKKRGKQAIPAKWPCADNAHKNLLAECKKLGGPLDEFSTGNKSDIAEVR